MPTSTAIKLDNRRSIALTKSIKIRKEGNKRRYIFEDGAWADHVVFVANPENVGLKSRQSL
jgi:RimJ/RimL family protein N-acetyltransferase